MAAAVSYRQRSAPGAHRSRAAASAATLDLERLAELLAPKVAAIVLAQIAGALGAAQAPYSTRRGHEPPEFLAERRKWKAVASTIPARQLGDGQHAPRRLLDVDRFAG